MVTRRPDQSPTLVVGLRELGATVIELPTVELAPPLDPGHLDATLRRLSEFQWIVFTSPNTVRAVREVASRLSLAPHLGPATRGADAPRRGGNPSAEAVTSEVSALSVASVGSATSEALAQAWPDLRVALEPASDFGAAGLLTEFARVEVRGSRILLPGSDMARDELASGLEALGAEVERVTAYRTVTPAGLQERVAALMDGGFDLVVFASPSAVKGFASAAPGGVAGIPAAVIGPTTEASARGAGFTVRAVASPATAAGLVRAVATAADTMPSAP